MVPQTVAEMRGRIRESIEKLRTGDSLDDDARRDLAHLLANLETVLDSPPSDAMQERPILLTEVRLADPYLRAMVLGPLVLMVGCFAYYCVVERNLGFAIVGTLLAPVAAVVGIAAVGTWSLVRWFAEKKRSNTT